MMLNFSDVEMEEVVIHRVGNKIRDEELVLSKSSIRIEDEQIQQLLFQYLLNPFRKVDAVNCFSHNTDIRFNEVYMYVSQVFSERSHLLPQSINVARHLFDNATHPRVKGGEFYMVYFSGIRFGDIVTDAVGMFRTENKEMYLKVTAQDQAFTVSYDNGININMLDKGCLVLNIDAEHGYKVFIVDVHGKGANEARYWRDDFLRVSPVKTEDSMAEACIQMVGHFVDESFQHEEKMKPVELRAKAVQFFEENTTFDMARFETEVLEQPQYVQSFRDYRTEYQDASGVEAPSTFSISPTAVQTMKRRMKSVIKLDSRFDIYVRGHQAENLKFIERGRDDSKGMNFYKLYFNEEN